MNRFAEKKDIELKSKLEIDEIKKQLRMIQKVKLTAMDGDKKRELERLAVERENIRLKEYSLLEEIQKLNDSII